MAKLTVTFKGRTIQHFNLETGSTSIGCDPDNALQIDSLAIAPHHATVDVEARGFVVKALQDNFPLQVNGRKVEEHVLKDGDCIALGKHEVYFMDDRHFSPMKGHKPDPANDQASFTSVPDVPQALSDASLQVLNGKQIGLVIPLRNPVNQIERDDSIPAVIARRADGYYLAQLSPDNIDGSITVNGEPIGSSNALLNDGDLIKINQHKLRFFLDR
jgi:pSer/pThr/pTyr-binding forkhead associated (FHA) protein